MLRIIFMLSWFCAAVGHPRLKADTNRLWDGWDSDRMHPVGDVIIHSRRRVATDWDTIAEEELQRTLQKTRQYGVAKNIIIFLGDGLGLPTVTTARFLKAQRSNIPVHQAMLSFEEFPDLGLAQTYNADRMVTDSAGAATAILCGQKVNFYTVGVNENVLLRNCSNVNENKLTSIVVHGMNAGKLSGVVTNTRITHASPSAVYAHHAYRELEAFTPDWWPHPEQCPDIAYQMVHNEDSQNINVFFGGGLRNFIPEEEIIPGHGENGDRRDGTNLINEWLRIKDESGVPAASYQYVSDKSEFDAIDVSSVDYVLGLFTPSHMNFEVDRQNQNPIQEPSLVEMVEKAINILEKGQEGYILFVEGGRIDHAHHDNIAYRALDETLMFAEAVTKAVELTDINDTLIVVTGDHSHSFAFSGYPEMDSDILGTYTSFWEPDDGLPYTPLSYVNGPGYYTHRTVNGSLVQRMNLTGVDTTTDTYVQDAGVPISSETHGGEDTPIYARGPMSFLFQGEHQQHYLGHAMLYAACIGPYSNEEHCPTINNNSGVQSSFRLSSNYYNFFALNVIISLFIIPRLITNEN